MRVALEATTAAEARREAARLYPEGGRLFGFVGASIDPIYMSTVREKGNRAPVATVKRAGTLRPSRFIFEPTEAR